MTASELIQSIKRHPDFHKVGMILCHNGVVRGTSRDGRPVTGLQVAVDSERLEAVLREHRRRPGIVDIGVHIFADHPLKVGDDVMLLAIAGDIRENVLQTMEDVLNAIKTTVTHKTEYFKPSGD
jgi:molybdopterin synthase catalytic subunit